MHRHAKCGLEPELRSQLTEAASQHGAFTRGADALDPKLSGAIVELNSGWLASESGLCFEDLMCCRSAHVDS